MAMQLVFVTVDDGGNTKRIVRPSFYQFLLLTVSCTNSLKYNKLERSEYLLLFTLQKCLFHISSEKMLMKIFKCCK